MFTFSHIFKPSRKFRGSPSSKKHFRSKFPLFDIAASFGLNILKSDSLKRILIFPVSDFWDNFFPPVCNFSQEWSKYLQGLPYWFVILRKPRFPTRTIIWVKNRTCIFALGLAIWILTIGTNFEPRKMPKIINLCQN